ncbi:aminobenzoyl-glutamate utilization protein B [Lewinella marina]|uniref:Peptidase M20 n=1 Tax=Neolewinella marina TaxID=438751 RepID=A0A2G0CG03_9BACT|nr:amidohydrolase [Neolewinella marina]NJB85459.1 aminobenzoyl-glutamate utilization protein B [Neolewinella marina]PHK98850.1 peptidase M20 [Neolewinella marina]
MHHLFLTLVFLLIAGTFGHAQQMSAAKARLVESVDSRASRYIEMSDAIWALAETAFEEEASARILADYAEQVGFRVSRNLAGMPTAFTAEYGSGEPIIGILGEFDALPGTSQQARPKKAPLREGAAGHGCGHNLFGVGSLAAAIAVKEAMDRGEISGTIRYYGTPAEEKYFGKLYLAREGFFDDLDACLDWHPADKTEADVQSSLALVDFVVEFRGQAAHAAADPWNGRSAADAMELMSAGINAYREHVRPSVRIHTHMQQAGDVVNVVPDYARFWVRVRDSKRDGMLATYARVRKIAEGAATMADVDYQITLVSGLHEVLVNRTGGAVMQQNLELLGDIEYTDEEIAFAQAIQEATGKEQRGLDGTIHPLRETLENPGGASSDVGDVSWLVPEIRLGVTTAPIGTPWHSWAVVACGGMSIGHKGMLQAAKALALTAYDLYRSHETVTAMQAEFRERKGGAVYQAILPEGPPPIPKGK